MTYNGKQQSPAHTPIHFSTSQRQPLTFMVAPCLEQHIYIYTAISYLFIYLVQLLSCVQLFATP